MGVARRTLKIMLLVGRTRGRYRVNYTHTKAETAIFYILYLFTNSNIKLLLQPRASQLFLTLTANSRPIYCTMYILVTEVP